MRLILLVGSIILALGLAVWTSQTPQPRHEDVSPGAFSTTRAMLDVRQIARAPHPVGSEEHARVRLYLIGRMSELGLSPTQQVGPLSPQAIRRLEKAGGSPEAAEFQAINLIGRLPGTDGTQPAILIMAHYDTVIGSPGAADDSTGVAAALEVVRAIKARGAAKRDLILLLTDAEELNLDGARIFFSDHPLRDRIGAVVNLEARGGGGRAAMFETGLQNGDTIRLFGPVVRRADGGTTSSSLAVFMYEQMPNGTDFTIAKDRGIAGLNFAFIGRPAQYHSSSATPDNLDLGSVQHLGSQALETADALIRAPELPAKRPNLVYSDLFGQVLISHSIGFGWVLVVSSFALCGLSFWRVRQGFSLGYRSLLQGATDGLWLLGAGMVVIQGLRLLAGPLASRSSSSEDYYTLLKRLPWMELGAGIAVLALILIILGGVRHRWPRVTAGVIAVTTLATFVIGGFSPVILITGIITTGLSLWPLRRVPSLWGSWLGLILLVCLAGLVVQIIAPEAALLFLWPALVASLVATLTALTRPDLEDYRSLILPGFAAVVVGGWLLGTAHLTFLGIGMDIPGVTALFGVLILTFLRPLSPSPGQMRRFMAAAIVCLLLSAGVNLSAQLAIPTPAVDKALS